MIKAMAMALGPDPSYGFGPGAKVGAQENKEGGPGSGRNPEGEGSSQPSSHRGARIYSDDGKHPKAITPSGHQVGPFKNEQLLKNHLDKYSSEFKLTAAASEADSASTQVAQLRPAAKKESAISKNVPTNVPKILSLKESNSEPFKNHKFQVVLIKEGLGNFANRFFYTKNALQNAIPLFEGSQCFADHPSQIEEEVRPERSTRDILGYYENVKYQEDNGQGLLIADLVVADNISLDWAMSLLTNSLEYSKKFKEADLVGLSINASGAASPVSIDEFMNNQKLSENVLKKLMDAKTQGITEINVVDELKEAQSVDLVTKAGAGGRILKMLEQERDMEKENMEKQHENEDTKPAAADGAAASGAAPDHADEDQDKALFAKMIKQYLGKDDASPEEMEIAKHAHEAAMEMGHEGEAAYEAAGHHLKMAAAVGKKMAMKPAQAAPAAPDQQEAQTPPPAPKGDGPHDKMEKKESMKLVQLTGEVAKLRESVKKYELRDYLEDTLKKSKLPNAATKKFREALGVPKSKEQIDETLKVFTKAYEAKAEEVSDSFDGFLTEKQPLRESSASTKEVGLGDCLR